MVEMTEDERKKACSDLFERIDRFDSEAEGLVRLSEKCTDPYVAQVVYDQYEAKKCAFKEMEQELQKLGEFCKANRRDTEKLQIQASRLKNSFEKCRRLKDGFERSG
ncbi:MAG TPA: hypothetical protein VLK23_09070 [Thermodesulfobacteriota bacterium]|nr:hypothetical protein [Thermodesulfobacteriota bacterium]